MKEQLLEVLICPSCGRGTWTVERRQSSGDGDVDRGELVCLNCRARYVIERGIVDLLPQPDESVLRERAGWERFLQGASEELEEGWILALPCIDESVTANQWSRIHWKRQADNFFHLLELLGLRGDERVLELGAGRCWASAHLARIGCQVVALDVVRSARAGGLETGAVYLEHGTPHFERVLASMEKLPFRPGSVDLVLSVASIHHSPLLDRVVSQCARVLTPGGRLGLTSEPCVRLFGNKRVQNEETEAGINEHAYDLLDYRRAFRTAGLQAKFALPGAVEAMLQEGEDVPDAGRMKSLLFGFVRQLWGGGWLRRALRSQPANLVGLLFLEYGVTAVARKPMGGERR
jgi:SAM-dependent methyltransferase/uncharacterized protein YbaR (Trm112 family)